MNFPNAHFFRSCCGILLLLPFVTACFHKSGVEVQNAANVTIENIEIHVAGNELAIDSLSSGSSRRIGYTTKTEETLSLSFLIQGTQRRCSSGAYVSPPFEDEFSVSIAADGECSISQKIVPNGVVD